MISIEEALRTAFYCLVAGLRDKAEQIARLIMEISPDNIEGQFLMGKALFAQGKREEAIAIFDRILWSGQVARWHVLQAAIARLNAINYLEIGVAEGFNFLQIEIASKYGVDPESPAQMVQYLMKQSANTRYLQMTSDAFFQAMSDDIYSTGIDVAFVDGLHTYSQTLIDVENCLKHLTPSGIVFVHDCNPESAAVAMPVNSLEEVRQRGWNGPWTGDVWKTVLYLRSCRNDLIVHVLDCEFGIGVIRQGRPDTLLPYTPEQIALLSFNDLANNRAEFLGLIQPHQLMAQLPLPREIQ